jgi:hypothetical protein
VVPVKFRKDIFFNFHNISHPGRLAYCRLVSFKDVLPGLAQDVATWAKTCLHCQQSKTHRHIRTWLLPIPVMQQPFSHLHIDMVGPLQFSNNCNYIFTTIDRTSKWMDAITLSVISATDCARALLFHRIMCFRGTCYVHFCSGTTFYIKCMGCTVRHA